MLTDLKARWEADESSRAVVRELRRWSVGEPTNRPKMPGESLEHLAGRPRFSPRFFARALDLLGSTYTRPAVRSGESGGLWTAGVGLDAVMAEADRESLIGGTALLLLVRGTDRVVRPMVVGRDRYVAAATGPDPRQITEVYVLWRESAASSVIAGTTATGADYVYADQNGATLYRANGEQEAIDIAFAALPSTIATTDWTGVPLGGQTLIDSLRAIRLLLEEIIWTGLLQRGQPVVYDPDRVPAGQGPDVPWVLDRDSRAEILANNANLSGMLAVLQVCLDSLSTAWGLPRQQFVVASIQAPYSAAVLQAIQAELESTLQARQQVLRQWERAAHALWTAYTGIPCRLDSISYPAPPPPMTTTEMLAVVRAEAELGLVPRIAQLATLEPHRTEAEIRRLVEEAESERADVAAQQAAVAGHALPQEMNEEAPNG